jgi:hypothetical protein
MVSMLEELEDSGVFSWNGYIDCPLLPDGGHVRLGMVLMKQCC